MTEPEKNPDHSSKGVGRESSLGKYAKAGRPKFTPEQKAAASERMKQRHAEGKLSQSIESKLERQPAALQYARQQMEIEMYRALKSLLNAEGASKKKYDVSRLVHHMALLKIELSAATIAAAVTGIGTGKLPKNVKDEIETNTAEVDAVVAKMEAEEAAEQSAETEKGD